MSFGCWTRRSYDGVVLEYLDPQGYSRVMACALADEDEAARAASELEMPMVKPPRTIRRRPVARD
jgi:hypothetical protein